MKKFYTAFKNENVQAAIIIATVFLITAVGALYIILTGHV